MQATSRIRHVELECHATRANGICRLHWLQYLPPLLTSKKAQHFSQNVSVLFLNSYIFNSFFIWQSHDGPVIESKLVTVFQWTKSCAGLKEYTGYSQKDSAVSKVNKKFISHLTRTQRTPSAAATAQVSHALPAIRFSRLLRGPGASFQDGVAAGKGFLCSGMNLITVWMCVMWPRVHTLKDCD